MVTDAAKMIADQAERAIESQLLAYEKETGNEIGIITITTSNGQDLHEWFGQLIQEGRQWRFGKFPQSNGVTIVLARDDRNWEIEVGVGFEALITDREAAKIGADELVPNLRAGSPERAIQEAIEALMGEIEPIIQTVPVPPRSTYVPSAPTISSPSYRTDENAFEPSEVYSENEYETGTGLNLKKLLALLALVATGGGGLYLANKRRKLKAILAEVEALKPVLKNLENDLSQYPDWAQEEAAQHIETIRELIKEFEVQCAEANLMTTSNVLKQNPQDKIAVNAAAIEEVQNRSDKFEAEAEPTLNQANTDQDSLRSSIIKHAQRGFETGKYRTPQFQFESDIKRLEATLVLAKEDEGFYREIYKEAKHISAQSNIMFAELESLEGIRDQVSVNLPILEKRRLELARQIRSYQAKLQNLRAVYPPSAYEDLEEEYGRIEPEAGGVSRLLDSAKTANDMKVQDFLGAQETSRQAEHRLNFISNNFRSIDQRKIDQENAKKQVLQDFNTANALNKSAQNKLSLEYVNRNTKETFTINVKHHQALLDFVHSEKIDWMAVKQKIDAINKKYRGIAKNAEEENSSGEQFFKDLSSAQYTFNDSDVSYRARSMRDEAKRIANSSNPNWVQALKQLESAKRQAKRDISDAEDDRQAARNAVSAASSSSSSSFGGGGGGSYGGGGAGGSW
jgi:uncharacterized protein